MLESLNITRRQSEIRQELSAIVGKTDPTEDETRSMETLDSEYRTNETRYRAAIIAEDEERKEAGEELETRSDNEFNNLIDKFEMRQVALALAEDAALSGETQEVVSEIRSQGGYEGIPVPWQALEKRAGETVAAGTPDPVRTAPIIERLFPDSVASKMGGSMVNVGIGELEYPVTTSNVTAGWGATSENSDVPGPSAYTTLDRPMKPDYNMGIQMELTRKSLKQSGAGLEQAVRRDMNGAIGQELDRTVFQGSGSNGEPTGLFAGASAWNITETAVDAAASYAAFRAAVVRFMTANAANGTNSVNLLLRPEIFDGMDDALITGTATSEWDRLKGKVGNVVLSANALAAPSGDPAVSKAVMTVKSGGVAPFFIGTWGAVDLIRDPYTKAKSGNLLITALATMDITVSRSVQTEILTGIE